MADDYLELDFEHLNISADELFNELPTFASVIDLNFRIIKSNRKFQREFGDRTGQYCYSVYKNRQSVCLNCPVNRTINDGYIYQNEDVIQLDSGGQINVLIQSVPLRDRQGKLVAVLELITDISSIKSLEIEVKRREEAYQYLFDRVPCFISVQNRDFQITQMNRYAKRQFGDRIGEHCFEVFKRNDRVCVNCPVKRCFQDGGIYSTEELIITRDGREINAIVHTSPLRNQDGEIVSVMEIFSDITEVKKLQQELVLVGQVVAEMAHQIKNVLMGLEGGIFVVNEGLANNQDQMVRQGFEMVERNVQHISRIVKDLLYCSREREPEYELCQINDIASEVYQIFLPRMKKENITFNLNLDQTIPECLLDRSNIQKALTNLVANALDACLYDPTREDHCINISTRLNPSTNYISISVTDNGVGMDSEWKGKIFNQFISSKGSKGTGLGLMVVNKVVKEHGGTITVESEPGVGSIFTINLPLKRELKSS